LQANAAALAGVGFSDLGLVMNQVQSQNKAYTQDLNQVASRGIPIYQSLAKVYGISALTSFGEAR
jgi:tape measure domain-containing protein